MTRRTIILGLALVAVMAATTAMAETLFVQGRSVAVKQGPGSYYRTVFTAVQGQKLTVVRRRGGWIMVRSAAGQGWVYHLALGKTPQRKSFTRRFIGTANTSTVDRTAGFKGFNRDTEQAYISRSGLGRQLQELDALAQYRPGAADVERFIRSGRLAR
jgi:uncharacterized protein YraI